MRTDRLLGILTTLLQNGTVTAPQLAEKFEVSRRTITRDIDALGRAGIPMVTTQGKGGGIAIAAGYRLEAALLTQDELQAILAGVKSLDGLLNSDHMAALAEKLGAGRRQVLEADDLFLIDLATYYKDDLAKKMALVQRAAREKHTLRFCYYYAKGESMREVEPYRLVFHWGGWYLYSWCLERQAFRLFKLNRMWELEVTGRSFDPRPVRLEELDFDPGMGGDEVHLVARFQQRAKYRLVEEYGPDCYTEQPNGDLLFRRDFYDPEYMRSWLLGMGDAVTVLEPAWAARQIAERARRILALYPAEESGGGLKKEGGCAYGDQ